MISYRELKNILDTYPLETILELNELTEEDALRFMLDIGFVKLPEPKPVDVEI